MKSFDPLSSRLTSRERRALGQPEDRRAAVAVVLRPSDAGPEVLLLRRAEDPRDPWSGNISFPGGRADPEDLDTLATAVRETREEIGLDLTTHARYLGPLDDLRAVARSRSIDLIISPHVFVLTSGVTLQLDPVEIADARWTLVGPLMRGERGTSHPFVYQGQSMSMPAHDVDGWIVWGLTYMMLQTLLDELRTLLADPL